MKSKEKIKSENFLDETIIRSLLILSSKLKLI